jgi:cytochrome c553
MTRRVRAAAACAVLALSFGAAMAVVAAQTPAPAANVPAIWRGVYTDAQAMRGRDAYAANGCGSCHTNDLTGNARTGPALRGAAFMAKWDAQSLQRVYRVIREQMPRNNPGTLTDQAAVDLLAFILQSNGMPAGGSELTAAPAALDALTVVGREGPARKELPNFALVQTVGCLVEASPRAWRLTQASEFVATKDVPASQADLAAAETAAPGTQTLQLVSVMPFRPDANRNVRVLVKGILNRYPGEDPLLNVVGLQPLQAACAP